MDVETARYVNDLEGRLTALSGIVRLMMWIMRERGVLDAEMERQLFRSASDAAGSLAPDLAASADRMILALQGAVREPGSSSAHRDGLAARD
jgi:hypothetical protein